MTAPAITETPHLRPASSPALRRDACKLREHANHEWRIVAARGVPRDRLCQSDYWSVVADQFLPYDKLFIISEGRDWYAEALVLECGRGYASVIELCFHPLPALLVSGEGLPPNHEIYHAGPDKRYCVKRCSDGVVMGEGFNSRDEAVEFLISHASLR